MVGGAPCAVFKAQILEPSLGLTPLILSKQAEVILSPQAFRCCDGLGVQPVASAADAGMRRCDLKKRLSHLQELLRLFAVQWGEAALSDWCSKAFTDPAAEWQTLHEILLSSKQGPVLSRARLKSRGLVLPLVNPAEPSALWSLAMAMGWQLGLKAVVYRLGHGIGQLLKWLEKADVVMVEHVDRLWEAHLLLEFESIIHACYNAEIPLWLARAPSLADKAVSAAAKKGRLSAEKIATAAAEKDRQKPLKYWISRGSLEKLAKTTEFTYQWEDPKGAQMSDNDRRAPRRTAPRFDFKLPWDVRR